jgi:hypothetical protein
MDTPFHMNTYVVSLNPKELQDLLDEVEASRRSRKRAWENLQEIRWVLKDATGVELPPPVRKTIDLEGRIVKDGVRKVVKDRQVALGDLSRAIREFRKFNVCPAGFISRSSDVNLPPSIHHRVLTHIDLSRF